MNRIASIMLAVSIVPSPLLCLCDSALGQACDSRWLPTQHSSARLFSNSHVIVDFDADNLTPPQLVRLGTMNVLTYDGVGLRAHRIPTEDSGTAEYRAATMWDPDGPGPLPERLVIGGYIPAEDPSLRNIVTWDGAAWHPLGQTLNGPVYSLCTWDPDGPGPVADLLIAAGAFTASGSTPLSRIARWDGTSWQPLASGFNGTVLALKVWDPDGQGPMIPQIFATGAFTQTAGSSISRIARWDGISWRSVGSGINQTGNTMTTWDPDGPGPERTNLVVGGFFTLASGVPAASLARWNGAAWQPIGSGTTGPVFALSVLPEPEIENGPDVLLVAGAFTAAGGVPASGVAAWNGASWRQVGNGLPGAVRSIVRCESSVMGFTQDTLVVGGTFDVVAGVTFRGLAQLIDDTWQPMVGGIAPRIVGDTVYVPTFVRGIVPWDSDGDGPGPASVVVTGAFYTADNRVANNVAAFDGRRWRSMGGGLPAWGYGITTWDVDGDGPANAQVVVCGYLDEGFGPSAPFVRKWDGTSWENLGTAFRVGTASATNRAVVSWDADGDGPLPAQLLLGGSFTSIDGVPISRLATWAGQGWEAFTSGANGTILSLVPFDPDGLGPTLPVLIAVGDFTSIGGVTASRVALWNGESWNPLGTGLSGGAAIKAIAWDPDDDGPQPTNLVVGGFFTSASSISVGGIARWDGQAWHPFDSELQSLVISLATWDPDGHGPLPTYLVAGGAFSTAGGSPGNAVVRWDGATWTPLGSGTDGYVRAMQPWPPEPTEPGPVELFVGGQFDRAGPYWADSFARWVHTPAPVVINGASSITANLGEEVVLTAPVAIAYDILPGLPLEYQWTHNGVPFGDTPSLTIPVVGPQHAGNYALEVSNACGTTRSTPILLHVGVCAADVNCDLVLDGFDVETQEKAVGGDTTDFCQPDPDFNGDFALDGFDVEAVELVVGGGPCP